MGCLYYFVLMISFAIYVSWFGIPSVSYDEPGVRSQSSICYQQKLPEIITAHEKNIEMASLANLIGCSMIACILNGIDNKTCALIIYGRLKEHPKSISVGLSNPKKHSEIISVGKEFGHDTLDYFFKINKNPESRVFENLFSKNVLYIFLALLFAPGIMSLRGSGVVPNLTTDDEDILDYIDKYSSASVMATNSPILKKKWGDLDDEDKLKLVSKNKKRLLIAFDNLELHTNTPDFIERFNKVLKEARRKKNGKKKT